EDMGCRDIALAVGADGKQVFLRETAGGKDQVVPAGGSTRGYLGRAVAGPDQVALAGVVAAHLVHAGEDQLRLAGERSDDGRCIAAMPAGRFPLRAPDHLPVLPIESRNETALQTVAVDDDERLVKHRRRAVAMLGLESTGFLLPENLTTQARGGAIEAIAVNKGAVDALAVAGRRGRGVRVLGVLAQQVPLVGQPAPERLAGLAVEGQDELLLRPFVGGRQKDPLAPKQGARKPRSPQTMGLDCARPAPLVFQPTLLRGLHRVPPCRSRLLPPSAGPRHHGQSLAAACNRESLGFAASEGTLFPDEVIRKAGSSRPASNVTTSGVVRMRFLSGQAWWEGQVSSHDYRQKGVEIKERGPVSVSRFQDPSVARGLARPYHRQA